MEKPDNTIPAKRETVERMKKIELEEKLYEYIQREDAEGNPEAQEKYEARLNQFKQYQRKYYVRPGTRNLQIVGKKVKRPSYSQSLPELLRIADLSLVDFYQLGEIEVPFPFPEVPDIVEVCDSLSPECRGRMKELAMSLSNDWWKEYSKTERHRPTRRVCEIFYRVVPIIDRYTIAPEILQYVYSDKHKAYAIPAEAFPEIAQFLRVSLHWITCMPDDIRCFGQNADTDVILDAFSFMSPATRRDFTASLRYEKECEVTTGNA